MEKTYRELTPKEKAWIKEFQAVMKKAPHTLFLFVGEGITVYPKDENGQRYTTPFGGIDSTANGTGISTTLEYDGGAY